MDKFRFFLSVLSNHGRNLMLPETWENLGFHDEQEMDSVAVDKNAKDDSSKLPKR